MLKKLLVCFLAVMVCLCMGMAVSCGRSSTQEHEHTYSKMWEYNEQYHWKNSTCEHAGLYKDRARHSWNDGVTVSATYQSAGYTEYTCEICGYIKTQTIAKLEHEYSSSWSFDDNTHWHACVDNGYENLKADEASHAFVETAFDQTTGYATYSCDCGLSKQYLKTTIIELPTISSAYIGQRLSEVTLLGGQGNVEGLFSWTMPDTKITQSGAYSLTFTPNNSDYATIKTQIQVNATQLSINIIVGENGSASVTGLVSVDYATDFTVNFTPDSGYIVDYITVDGTSVPTANSYTFTNITSSSVLEVAFKRRTTQCSVSVNLGEGGSANYGGNVEVDYGGSLTVIYSPNTGYQVDTVIVDGSLVSATGSYTFSNITQNHTINITFKQNLTSTHTVTVVAGEGGVANYSGNISVSEGGSLALIFTPNEGYEIDTLTVDGTVINATTTYTLNDIIGNHSILVTFKKITYTVNISVGNGGSANYIGEVKVERGSFLALKFTPNEGYIVDTLTVDGNLVQSTTEYTISNITSNHEVLVTFKQKTNEYAISVNTGNGGSANYSGEVVVNQGDNLQIVFTPNSGYEIDTLTVDGASLTPTLEYAFTNITDDHSITATFKKIENQVAVTVSVGNGGSTNYSGAVVVDSGDNLTLTFTPNTGYQIDTLAVDGNIVTPTTTYTLLNITESHTVAVTFKQITYTVSVSVGAGGSANYSGNITVNYGGSLDLKFTPNTGYQIDTLTVDGNIVTPSTTYTLVNITENHSVAVTFKPTIEQYAITISVGEGGSCNYGGEVIVNNGESLTLTFTPHTGYEIDTLTVDGSLVTASTSYTISNITTNHTVAVTFKAVENRTYTITYVSGSMNAYTITDNTITFNAISMDTVYSISGTLDGNIIIDVGDTYKFDLELSGFTLTSSTVAPIIALSGSEVAIQAKVGTQNYIYDNRTAVDPLDTTQYSGCVYSMVDLELSGKGSLSVISENNNGIHGKDDLQVKNLTLLVKSIDNCLKGNDSVSIDYATTTLISRQGDAIKTVNSHINSTTLNQKGNITITGGTHNLYAACDGLDASYDVIINDPTTVLNIYTDQFSEYSEEITTVSSNTYYLRYSSNAYTYSVYYFNSSSDYKWVNVSTTVYSTVSSGGGFGGSSTYYFYAFEKVSGYSSMIIYMYSSNQTQGQSSSYYKCTSTLAVNQNYDTLTLSVRSSSLSASWTSYESASSTTSQGGGGMGGMQEGNSNKGTYSTKAIKSANDITVNDGTILVKAYDDAIHAGNFVDGVSQVLENGEYSTGNLTILGGTLTAYTYDDGLHADGILTVSGGTVKVTGSYEGMEGYNIVVSGGDISIVSSDDGFNSGATSGAGITISGGKVYIYAGGDGIDSNSTTSKGAILFKGGDVVVFCTSGGNAAIDSDGGYTHSGGRVIALTSSGGMTSECTNGNSTGMTVKSSISLSSYLTVTVGGSTVATVKMPSSMSAHVVYLGSSSATIASATSSSSTLDSNGVCWN